MEAEEEWFVEATKQEGLVEWLVEKHPKSISKYL